MAKGLTVYYDEHADVLSLSRGKPKAAIRAPRRSWG